ncbi:hypothetical protein BDM02DRAFT_1844321 [Thelephora ganbajun]|uniref:Uncharacterized protein n=1 Tax=Thelephora ganbajun TaxID=370292 RepID=A0ACB6ZIG1_THEGA|nr:hypothetical protein BDM02DRAFT_1844321 [Thelephora ganbajun]
MDLGANPANNGNTEQIVGSGSSERWTTYQSPLQSYHFSRWHLHLTDPSDLSNTSTTGSSDGLSILTPSGSFSSNSASGSPSADSKDSTIPGSLLRSLKMVTFFKSHDLDKRICQFEIPGGGVCRDDKCEDLHIERELETWEPSDDDTAQYLFEALVKSSQDQRPRRSATDVKNALEEIRTRKETMELGFEDRVSAALSILGVS